jgi:hypothetical protein
VSVTISADRIAQATGLTSRRIHQRANAEFWMSTTTAVRGGQQKQYFVGALPQDVRGKVVEMMAAEEMAAVKDSAPDSLRSLVKAKIDSGTRIPLDIAAALCERELAAETPALPATVTGSLPTAHLTDNQRAIAEARMSLLA